MKKKGIEVNTFNGSLLWEPWNVLKNEGTPYKVFTPYYRRGCLNAVEPRRPLEKPKKIDFHEVKNFKSLSLLATNIGKIKNELSNLKLGNTIFLFFEKQPI